MHIIKSIFNKAEVQKKYRPASVIMWQSKINWDVIKSAYAMGISFVLMSAFYQKAFALTNVRIKIYKKEIKPVKILSYEISMLLSFKLTIKIRIVKI